MRVALMLAAAIAVLAGLAASDTASAGGWSVVTLDASPEGVVAGKDIAVGFRVLSHGQTPAEGLDARILATHRQSGRGVWFDTSEDAPGHYTASINLPEAGTWDWVVESWGTTPLHPIEVSAATGAEVDSPAVAPAPAVVAPSRPWQWTATAGAASALFLVAGIAALAGRRTPARA